MAVLRREVLKKYRQILRVSRTWRASEEMETAAEQHYIKEEARRLFRKNEHVSGRENACGFVAISSKGGGTGM